MTKYIKQKIHYNWINIHKYMYIYIHNRQYIHPNPKFSFFVLFPCRGEFQPEGHDAFPDAFPDASWAATFADPDPAEPAEPAENGGAVPPWRSQELPPPPKRVSSLATNNATVRVKRFRRAQPTQPTQLTQPTQPTEPTEPTARVPWMWIGRGSVSGSQQADQAMSEH